MVVSILSRVRNRRDAEDKTKITYIAYVKQMCACRLINPVSM